MSDERRSAEPHDRFTRLCDAMIVTLVTQTEYDADVKCIVFLNDDERGGLVLHGYEDDAEAISDLLIHLRAIFRSNGQELLFAPIGKG